MLSMGVSSVAALVTVPINVHYIPVDLYGAWIASGNILAWATVIDPGLSTVIQQQAAAAYGGGDLKLLGRITGGGVAMNTLVATILVFVASFLVLFLPSILGIPADKLPYGELQMACWVSCIGFFFNVAAYAITAVCLGIQSSVAVGTIFLVGLIGSFILQIYLVMHGWGPMGIALATVFRGVVVLVGDGIYLGYRFLQEKIPVLWDSAVTRKLLSLVSFTFASKTVATFASNLDSLLIVRLISPEAAVAMRSTRSTVDICSSLVSRPAAGVAPVVSHLAGAGELESKRHQLVRLIKYSIWICLLAVTGLIALNKTFVTLWVGAALYAGNPTTLVLCLSLFVVALAGLFSNLTTAIGEIRSTSVVTAIQAAVSITCLYVGGKFFGLPGIAAATGVGSVVTVIYCAKLLWKHRVLTADTVRELVAETLRCVLALAVTTAVSILFVHTTVSWVGFVLAAGAVVVVFFAVLYMISPSLRSESAKFANLKRFLKR
ncbi:MAG: hypothetical protein BGO12_21510 [Verrucomicrobia bacterium 61-8]|nr:MAG: hypothetical protein BGO12_21510 [Verrucomicrobia bacterium 61-8]